ncbi:MAG: gliding motility-associated C-terminal domain-containing protein [Bacteroidia bacterium]
MMLSPYAVVFRYGLVLAFWLVALNLSAQIPFQRSILTSDAVEVRSLVSAPSGGMVMSGGIFSPNNPTQGFLVRVDPCGDLEWMKTYDMPNDLIFNHGIITLDGGYLMTGSFRSGASQQELIVVKTDGLGNILWHQTFRGGDEDLAYAVEEVRSNGIPQAYLISGTTRSYGEGENDILLLSLDLNGGINWQRQYGGPENESAIRVLHNGTGQIICLGNTSSYGAIGNEQAFVMQIDLNTGSPNWFKTYQMGNFDRLSGLQIANNGDILVSGQTDARGGQTQSDYWMMRLNSQGTPLWSKIYGTNAEERGFELIAMPSGGFTLGGIGVDIAAGDTDLAALHIDDNGNLQWAMAYGSVAAEGDFQESHYTLGANLSGGLWLGISSFQNSGAIEPFYLFTDSLGLTGGLCNDYPQSLLSLDMMPSIAEPALGINAFGFSTPALPNVQSQSLAVLDLCPPLYLDLGPDTILCPRQTLNASVQSFPGASYLWSTNETDTSILITQAGTYWIEVSVNACPRRDTIVVDYHPDLNLLSQDSTSICQGDSMLLSVPQGVILNTWQWNNGSLDSNLTISQAGLYALSASTDFCAYQDSFVLSVNQPPNVELGPDTSICPQSLLLLDAFHPGASYLWQDGSIQSDFVVSDSGMYQVQVSIAPCVVWDTIQIDLRTVAVPDLGPDTTLCLGEQISLQNPFPNQTALWSDGSTLDSLIIGQAGIYWLESFDGFCPSRDSFQLYILANESVDLGVDTTICQGEELVLDPGFPGTQRIWQGTIDQATFTADSSAWYWVQVIAPLCDDTDSIFVSVQEPPTIEIGVDTLRFCLGDSLFLDVLDDPSLSYLWDDGVMMADRWLKDSAWLRLRVFDNLCQNVDSIYIATPPVPVFSLGADSSLCEGDSLSLMPNSNVGALLWSDGSTVARLSVLRSGTYWLTQSVVGCSYRDSVSLNFLPYPDLDLGADTTLCEGQTILLGVDAQPGVQYLWQDASTNERLLAGEAGLFTLRGTLGQCSSTDEILLSYDRLPQFSLGPDTAFCTLDEGLEINPLLPAYQQLIWSTGAREPSIYIDEPGQYGLTLSTEVCGELRDTIEVLEYPCICLIFFPSAFSPNQDGLNEQFLGIGDCQPFDYDFQVFNRWGSLMFSSKQKEESWDGTYNGSPCPEGVYVWVARYRFRDRGGWRDDFKRGTVSLIR